PIHHVEREPRAPVHRPVSNQPVEETPEEKEKSKVPLLAGALLIVAVVAAIIYFFSLKTPKTTTAQIPQPLPQQQVLTQDQIKGSGTETFGRRSTQGSRRSAEER